MRPWSLLVVVVIAGLAMAASAQKGGSGRGRGSGRAKVTLSKGATHHPEMKGLQIFGRGGKAKTVSEEHIAKVARDVASRVDTSSAAVVGFNPLGSRIASELRKRGVAVHVFVTDQDPQPTVLAAIEAEFSITALTRHDESDNRVHLRPFETIIDTSGGKFVPRGIKTIVPKVH